MSHQLVSREWCSTQFIEVVMSCYHQRQVKVVIPEGEGWTQRLCEVPVWLVIPRHSNSVTQEKWGFLVKSGLWAKVGHPRSSNSPGRKATFSALQPLKRQLWPLGLQASACRSQNAPGGKSCPELWLCLIAFSWLSHSRPAPSPLWLRMEVWGLEDWLPADVAGRLSYSQQFMEVTRSMFSSLFSCPLKQHFE